MNRSTIARDLIILILLIGCCLGIYDHLHKRSERTATISVPVTNVTQTAGPVRDVPTASPADRAEVKAATNKHTVQASVTTAVNHSTGEGTVTVAEPTAQAPTPESPTTPAAPAQPLRVNFKDYRLEFTVEGTHARYALDQNFVVIQTLERAKDGTRSAKAQVFEVTPTGRVPLQQVTTQVVERDDTIPHWLTGFNVQGGIRPGPKSAVVGLQWLKHGRANNPADLKYAILTPVVTFGSGGVDVGLLPVSFNVANYIPHQPTTNVWVSPYIGYVERKLGAVVSVTF